MVNRLYDSITKDPHFPIITSLLLHRVLEMSLRPAFKFNEDFLDKRQFRAAILFLMREDNLPFEINVINLLVIVRLDVFEISCEVWLLANQILYGLLLSKH